LHSVSLSYRLIPLRWVPANPTYRWNYFRSSHFAHRFYLWAPPLHVRWLERGSSFWNTLGWWYPLQTLERKMQRNQRKKYHCFRCYRAENHVPPSRMHLWIQKMLKTNDRFEKGKMNQKVRYFTSLFPIFLDDLGLSTHFSKLIRRYLSNGATR